MQVTITLERVFIQRRSRLTAVTRDVTSRPDPVAGHVDVHPTRAAAASRRAQVFHFQLSRLDPTPSLPVSSVSLYSRLGPCETHANADTERTGGALLSFDVRYARRAPGGDTAHAAPPPTGPCTSGCDANEAERPYTCPHKASDE